MCLSQNILCYFPVSLISFSKYEDEFSQLRAMLSIMLIFCEFELKYANKRQECIYVSPIRLFRGILRSTVFWLCRIYTFLWILLISLCGNAMECGNQRKISIVSTPHSSNILFFKLCVLTFYLENFLSRQ